MLPVRHLPVHGRRRGALARQALRGAALLSAAGLLAGCNMVVMDPAGDVAVQQRNLILASTALMLLVIVPVIVLTFLFAWRYRASNPEGTYDPEFHHSTQLEVVIWTVPLLIIIALGAMTWISTHTLDPYRPLGRIAPGKPVPADVKPLQVQVVSLDWKWLFIYPEQGIASVNELVVPAGAPVHFSMASASVMNTFSIPQLGGMIYVMNGMVTQINLQADHPGEFYGRSAHFSGDGFSDMKFTTRAVPEAEFNRWVETVRGSGPALDRATYSELMRQSVPDRPFTYGSVEHDLFAAVTTQRIPPAPGPRGGRGGPGIEEKAEK